jgi:acetyl-CoA C-acetyltransferase
MQVNLGDVLASTNCIHKELLAQVLNGLQTRVGFDPHDVDDVIAGNACNKGVHGACIGRLSMLTTG